jgi:transcriptional regulator with XRE-family HTH domain
MPNSAQSRPAPKGTKTHRDPAHRDIGGLVRRQRQARKLTLEGLAAASGVSRAAISKIERGEVSATTPILGKLAEALDLTISQLVGGVHAKAVVHIAPREQPVFRERASGFERRSLSPLYRGRGVDFVLNTLPPRSKTGPFPAHRAGVEEHLYVSRGRLRVILGGETYDLDPGHVLFYPGDLAHTFENLSSRPCEYFIVIDSTRLQ